MHWIQKWYPQTISFFLSSCFWRTLYSVSIQCLDRTNNWLLCFLAFHDNWKQRLKQREDAKRVLSELKEKQREMENKSRGGSITTTGAIHHRRTSIVSKSSRNDSISTGAHHTVLNTQTRSKNIPLLNKSSEIL